jgi:predicted XRE-type DNA-binding protein
MGQIMNIKTQLAQLLSEVLERDTRPEAQVAEALGMTRQRLYQLKTGNKVASSEAIVEALERLGYTVKIELVETDLE